MANPPSKQEIWEAIGKIKNGKAGGESGTLPEMLKAICDEKEILEMLLSLSIKCGRSVEFLQIGVMLY